MNNPEEMSVPLGTALPENATPGVVAETEVSEVAAEQPSETDAPAEADSATEAPSPRFNTMTKEELSAELQKIVDANNMTAHRTVASIKAAFYLIRNKEVYEEMNAFVEAGNDPAAFTSQADPAESAFKDLLAVFRDRRNAYLEAEEVRRLENLGAKNTILDSMRAIAEDIDNVGVNFSKFQQLQQEFKVKAELPAGAENDLWKMYQTVNETFYDRLKMNKELRDLDFKKNLELKRALIDRAKELAEMEDVVSAGNRLQSLHAEWREVGPVAKELRDSVWDEFKGYSTTVHRRQQEYFENRKAKEQANEQAKNEIITEMEGINARELKSLNAWDDAAKEVIALQTKWRTIGFASRKSNNSLFARFRALCDDFFTRKTEYVKSVRGEHAENLRKKTDLCQRAEALASESDLKKAIEQVTALQAEWKTVGPVSRKYSDEVWKRFTAACNVVYDARRNASSTRRSTENANLKAKRDLIERLTALPVDGDQKEVMDTVRSIQDEWQKIGHVPFSMKDTIYNDYRAACDRLYDAYGARAARQRAARFESRIDNMRGDERRVNRERDRLVWSLDQKKAELKTIHNNLGFFNIKSSAGSSLVKDIERRATRLEGEIAQLEEKIALLDAKSDKKE